MTLRSKILLSISTFFGVYLILFFLFQVLSFNAALTMMGQNGDESTLKAIEKQYHLNQSASTRCLLQLNDILPIGIYSIDPNSMIYFDTLNYTGQKIVSINSHQALYLKKTYLGRSFQSQELVSTLLWDRFKMTLLLTLLSITIASIVGIGLGILSSMYPHTKIDNAIMFFSTMGISAPSFFVAIILALVFGYYLSDMTGLNFKGSLIEYTDYGVPYYCFKNLILPILALGWRPIAIISQMTRNSMLEVMHEDYIRTARAKGLSNTVIFWKHGLINALNPVITSISGWFGSLLAGAYFVEMIFDIKGLGALSVNALLKYDIPVVMGASMYVSFTFILISFGVDYLYRVIDPRVRV